MNHDNSYFVDMGMTPLLYLFEVVSTNISISPGIRIDRSSSNYSLREIEERRLRSLVAHGKDGYDRLDETMIIEKRRAIGPLRCSMSWWGSGWRSANR